MNTDRFWLRAFDIYNLYHGRYRRAVLTDEELRQTVTDFILGIRVLSCEWEATNDRIDAAKNTKVGLMDAR